MGMFATASRRAAAPVRLRRRPQHQPWRSPKHAVGRWRSHIGVWGSNPEVVRFHWLWLLSRNLGLRFCRCIVPATTRILIPGLHHLQSVKVSTEPAEDGTAVSQVVADILAIPPSEAFLFASTSHKAGNSGAEAINIFTKGLATMSLICNAWLAERPTGCRRHCVRCMHVQPWTLDGHT